MPDRQDDLNPAADLAPFADALKRLAPQPAHLSRDALLFEAGKAAGGPRLPAWVWPTVAGAFAALSLVLAAFLASPDSLPPPGQPAVVHVVPPHDSQPIPLPPAPINEAPAKPKEIKPDDSSPDQARMLQVRRDVLRWGVDMLPEPRPAATAPSPDVVARTITHWLNLPPGTFTTSTLQPKKKTSEDDDE